MQSLINAMFTFQGNGECYIVKSVSIGHSQKDQKLVFKTNYCLMQVKSIAERELSAILSTFIKRPFVIKIFVLSAFEWPFYTGFTVSELCYKRTILLRNYYRKMAMQWSFFYNSFVKFHGKNIWEHNMIICVISKSML